MCWTTAIAGMLRGETWGWFAPNYKKLSEAYNEIAEICDPVKDRSNKMDGLIMLITKGKIDFWSLEDEHAARGRKYHGIIIDEAAFTKPVIMTQTWERAIRPTLLDYGGIAIVASNTNGIDADNFFWQICNKPEMGFVEFWAPTHNNPHLPADEVAKLIRENPPLVYEQEYLAKFVDWSGNVYFPWDKVLVNGTYAELPRWCESVYAVIDTAVKTGKEHDGTAVIFFARMGNRVEDGSYANCAYPLLILDWDITQIQGDLLEVWLPSVFQRLEHYALKCRAHMGSIGVWIEDKSSGMILLMQAQRRGLCAQAIDSKLTSVGKDERAIAIGGYWHREWIKISEQAMNKVVPYKGNSRNHFQSQVVGFRIGDKTSNREDDLIDCLCYGAAIGLGDDR